MLPVLLICSIALASTTSSPAQSDPRYRLPHEVIERRADEQRAILEPALRFYKPPRGQSRWLDRTFLPEAATGEGVEVEPAVADELIRRLGAGAFCSSDALDRCRARQGGRLRMSAPYLVDADHARVVVEFESAWAAGPSIRSAQVFHLSRREGRWRIDRRAPIR